LYGQFLNATGRAKEAAAQFDAALQRTPNRRLSVEGLRQTTPARSTSQPQQ
jgi:hypothetical protein